jgi:hypothetical protein
VMRMGRGLLGRHYYWYIPQNMPPAGLQDF